MFKIRKFTVFFLFLLISILFLKNSTYINAEVCTERRCTSWHEAHPICSLNSTCGTEGRCDAYADLPIPCPCDNNCNGSCSLPSCPSGYNRTDPKNLCTRDTKTIKCGYKNDCGNGCEIAALCYRLETNLTPPSEPTSLSMIIDGQSYTLSPNSTTPTRVKYPSTQNNVKVSMPYVASDININRGLGYIFRANNYGVDNEWVEWTDCTNPRPEDFCKESTTNTTVFEPSSLRDVAVLGGQYDPYSTPSLGSECITYAYTKHPSLYCTAYKTTECTDYQYNGNRRYCASYKISYKTCDMHGTCIDYHPTSRPSLNLNSVLKQNSQGNIGGLYYSVNRCDDNRLYSSVYQSYYLVDNIPVICDPSKETCEDYSPVMEDHNLIITTPETETTSKGCKTTTHTGKEANNPLPIEIQAYDKDGNNEIQSAVIWFSKSGKTPKFPLLVSRYTYSNTQEIGIMIRKNGSSWSNTPLVYATNSDGSFAEVTNNTLKDSSGKNIITINNIEINEGTKITISFDITFLNSINSMFNVKSIVLDSFMFLHNGTIDLSYMKKYTDWGVDLTNPIIDDFHKDIVTPKTFNLSWNVTDNISKITNFVINAYRTDTGVNGTTSDITMQGKNNIRLNENGENVPDEDGLGLLTDTNTWQFNNLSSNPYTQTELVNINDNELGTITLQGNAYDQACNYTTTSSLQVRLDPWYGSKGGVLYSEGSLGIPAKDILNNSNIRNFVSTDIDKGTELLVSSGLYIANLFKPSLGAVRATNIYDTNLRVNFWYNYLLGKFEKKKENLKQVSNISECNTGENCYIYSTENISIPSGTVCKGRVIIISDKDIHIEPNIESISGNSGCIFLSANNISLGSGGYLSSNDIVGYDYIDALMLAENRIEIEYSDGEKSLRDGLEINGSLLSLGSKLNMDSGIYQRRDLRLYNAIYPSLLVNYSYKYTNLSDIFFGKDALLHKREVGSKGL